MAGLRRLLWSAAAAAAAAAQAGSNQVAVAPCFTMFDFSINETSRKIT